VLSMWIVWFKARCPVGQVEDEWITSSMRWLAAEFGPVPLRRPVVLPTDDFFPGGYRGTEADVQAVFQRLGVFMRLNLAPIRLEMVPDEESGLLGNLPVTYSRRGAAGHFQVVDGSPVVTVHMGQAKRPVSLVATLAHELAHVMLDATGADPARHDLEPLTDLLTVYFGLGIFNANAAFEYRRGASQRLGYLTEPMFGYALAHYALMREETKPDWARYLDPNPRAFLRKGLRYLTA
jgi:hypothetical protein